MFFGLMNSPARFQMIMDAIFREEITSRDIVIYMNNILIAIKESLDQHCCQVAQVLQKLYNNDLYLRPEKCQFHQNEVNYLGIIVGKEHVKMNPIKVQGIVDWPTSINLREL